MSHITLELHENFPYERIDESEYAVVREELGLIGFANIASSDGADRHLPRACYFGIAGTTEAASRCWQNLEKRLGRRVGLELTLGTSYGFGLKPVYKGIADLVSSPTNSMAYRTLAGLGNLGSVVSSTKLNPISVPNLSTRSLLSGKI